MQDRGYQDENICYVIMYLQKQKFVLTEDTR